MNTPQEKLRHYVTGAIQRGEAVAIEEIKPTQMLKTQSLKRQEKIKFRKSYQVTNKTKILL